MDSEDDLEIAAAIALSLQASDSKASNGRGGGTTENSDTEEDNEPSDVDWFLAPNSSNHTAASNLVNSTTVATSDGGSKLGEQQPSKTASRNDPDPSLPSRAQMEAERIARRKRMIENDDSLNGGTKRPRLSVNLPPNISSPPPSLASRTFYNGGFFPTSTIHANPRNDRREAISLADILGSSSTSDLKLAIISSYGLGSNPDWLYQHFNPSAPVILVVQTGSEEQRATMTKNIFPNWVQTCPKLGRGGCLHMKYMLLFYKTGRLRVVVSTANLLSLDWKHLENSVFLQDICLRSAPLIDGDSNASGETKQLNVNGHSEESFAKLLESVLKATNVVPALEHFKQNRSDLPLRSISDLSKLWDWSRVKAELVPSIAGKWEGWKQIKMTGHPRLMRAIETLGLTSGGAQKLVVECQGSSIGNYTTQWFNQFYLSASGQSSALKAHLDISEAKRKKLAYPSGVKVIFPTLNTVKNTDQHGSGSLFCKRKQWDAKNFPRDHFYDSKSRAGRVLMHTKMIVGTITRKSDSGSKKPSRDEDEQETAAGWMYVGSHNFTYAAWGNLTGSGSAPVMNVNNYELGVIVPLNTAEDVDTASAWERPARKYGSGDIPWIMQENR